MQVKEEGNGVTQREGHHRQQRAAGKPLQLLAQQGRVGLAVTAQEENRREHVEAGIVGRAGLVEPVQEQAGWLPCLDGPNPQAKQSGAGRIDQRQEPAAAETPKPLFGETKREMQKKRRLQRLGQHIAPQNGPVKRIEFASVLEAVECERDQAKQVEVSGARGRPAAEENVDADGQVDESDDAQPQSHAPVERLGNDHNGRVKRDAVAGDCVAGLAVNLSAVEDALEVSDPHDGGVADRGEQVFGLDLSALGRLIRQRLHSGEQILLLQVGLLGRAVGQNPGPGEQIVLLDACALAGTVG